MRVFVFLLILVNLVFFAWMQGFLSSAPEAEASRLSGQLLADRLHIVSRGEPPAMDGKTAQAGQKEKNDKGAEKKAPAEAERCLAWSDLSVADVGRAEKMVIEKFTGFKPAHVTKAGEPSYWVYIAPLPGKAEADKKAGELKKMRVPEYQVIQDAGPNRFAISLGVFSTKEAAEERLVALRSLGVRSAKIGERPGKVLVSLELRGPEGRTEALRQAIGELLPDARPADCKAVAVAQ